MTIKNQLGIYITIDTDKFDEAIARCINGLELFFALAKLETRRWLWPWMGAGLTVAVAIIAIWSGR